MAWLSSEVPSRVLKEYMPQLLLMTSRRELSCATCFIQATASIQGFSPRPKEQKSSLAPGACPIWSPSTPRPAVMPATWVPWVP